MFITLFLLIIIYELHLLFLQFVYILILLIYYDKLYKSYHTILLLNYIIITTAKIYKIFLTKKHTVKNKN